MKKKIKTFFVTIYYFLPYIIWIGLFFLGLIFFLVETDETILYIIVVSAIAATILTFIAMFTINLVVCIIKDDIEFNELLKSIREKEKKNKIRERISKEYKR